jgi:hypothetical protein
MSAREVACSVMARSVLEPQLPLQRDACAPSIGVTDPIDPFETRTDRPVLDARSLDPTVPHAADEWQLGCTVSNSDGGPWLALTARRPVEVLYCESVALSASPD